MKTTIETKTEPKTIPINEMKPCDVGFIMDSCYNNGILVMRTQNSDKFEVINLTDFRKNYHCDLRYNFNVRILAKGEKVTVTFEGE